MPYIKKEDRVQFDSEINALVNTITDLTNWDDLYYIISRLIMKTIKPKRYKQMLEVTGLLINIRQEFCRRIAGRVCYDYDEFETPIVWTDENYNTKFDFEISTLVMKLRDGCGDTYGNLNYVITSFLVKIYIHSIGLYDIEIISILAKLNNDFYSQIMAPYEDLKIEENGDVY